MRGCKPATDNEYARIRRAAGISQAEIAAKTGVSLPTVGSFERGRKLRAKTAMVIAGAYTALGFRAPTVLEFRLLSSEEVRLAQEYSATPILGKVVRMPADSLLTRSFKDALLEHREECGAKRRGYASHGQHTGQRWGNRSEG